MSTLIRKPQRWQLHLSWQRQPEIMLKPWPCKTKHWSTLSNIFWTNYLRVRSGPFPHGDFACALGLWWSTVGPLLVLFLFLASAEARPLTHTWVLVAWTLWSLSAAGKISARPEYRRCQSCSAENEPSWRSADAGSKVSSLLVSPQSPHQIAALLPRQAHPRVSPLRSWPFKVLSTVTLAFLTLVPPPPVLVAFL